MFERARVNKKFLVELTELDMYPMFYTPATTLDQLLQTFMPVEATPATGTPTEGVDTSKIEKIPEQLNPQE